jgi:hypothetical protein
VSINEELDDGLPLEEYIHQKQDQIDLSTDDISQETWIIYEEDENIRVTHREDRNNLEGLEFVYNDFQQLEKELEELNSDEGRYKHFKDNNSEGDPRHTIYDSQNHEQEWIQSTEMLSLQSER